MTLRNALASAAAEPAPLPDLDEFAGISIRDIAAAIVYSDPDSEDEQRAIAAIRARAPGIGHNRPPLAERLDDDLAPLRARADAILETAKSAAIIDDESAAKVADLAEIARKCLEELDAEGKHLLQPYRDAQQLIRDRIAAIADPLRLAREGPPAERGRGGLRGMLTAYDDRRRAAAEAAQRKAEEEQRAREAEAQKAREAADAKRRAGENSVGAELEVMKADEAADAAAARAAAIRNPEPVRANLGRVSRTREIRFEVTDERKAIAWAYKQEGLRGKLVQSLKTILGAYLRGLGVEAVERGVKIDGVEVRVELGAASVRR